MQATVLYGERDIRFEDRPDPTIVERSDAVIRLPVTCICGSDLWPYRGIPAVTSPAAMGHEYVHLHGGPAPVRKYLPHLIDLVFFTRTRAATES